MRTAQVRLVPGAAVALNFYLFSERVRLGTGASLLNPRGARAAQVAAGPRACPDGGGQ